MTDQPDANDRPTPEADPLTPPAPAIDDLLPPSPSPSPDVDESTDPTADAAPDDATAELPVDVDTDADTDTELGPDDTLGPYDNLGANAPAEASDDEAGAAEDDGEPTDPGDPDESAPGAAAGGGFDGPPPTGEPLGHFPPPPPPPPVGAPLPPRRLVRDPYSRLGGVASGLAHHYGLDVSIVRILFLLTALATGFGFLAYILAWIIIPRADHWPPGGVTRRPLTALSRRELGLGLAAAGLLAVLVLGGGTAGGFLVPLVLVAGGVWLLLQPNSETTAAFAGVGAPTAGTPGSGAAGPVGAPPADLGPGFMVTPPGPPVPPNRRRRPLAAIVVVVVVTALIGLVLLVGSLLALMAGAAFVVDGEFDQPVTYTIDDAGDLPLEVDRGAGEITVDLTGFDPATLDGTDAVIDIEMGAGAVAIVVPDDLPVEVDANVGFGDVAVFGRQDSGPASDIRYRDADADLDIIVNLGFGEVDVFRP